MAQDGRYTALYSLGRTEQPFEQDLETLRSEGLEVEVRESKDVELQDEDDGHVMVFPDRETAQEAAKFIYVWDNVEDEPIRGPAQLRMGANL